MNVRLLACEWSSSLNDPLFTLSSFSAGASGAETSIDQDIKVLHLRL
jgi:hypothetical protein